MWLRYEYIKKNLDMLTLQLCNATQKSVYWRAACVQAGRARKEEQLEEDTWGLQAGCCFLMSAVSVVIIHSFVHLHVVKSFVVLHN